MGREIRRVPPGWEHPTDKLGNYQPMFDHTIEHAQAEFRASKYAEVRALADTLDPLYYRREWENEPTAYQVYETITEGTPVSPVLLNEDELRGWLIGRGSSRVAADAFIKQGWVPTFEIKNGILKRGLDALED